MIGEDIVEIDLLVVVFPDSRLPSVFAGMTGNGILGFACGCVVGVVRHWDGYSACFIFIGVRVGWGKLSVLLIFEWLI